MQLFYIPDISDHEVFLNEDESKHAVKVLRLGNGNTVQITDGKGGLYRAEISDANQKKCRLTVTDKQAEFGKKDFRLHIAIAPTKNIDRFEWFIEKAAEIGIDEITPLLTARSERKTVNTERLEKILISAMKQSVKTYLPVLNKITCFNNLISTAICKNKYIAHCGHGEKNHLKNTVKKGEGILVLIGPEGDFTTEEVQYAQRRCFRETSLGNSKLRTETAGVIACSIVNMANE
ncbi:MAG: 16S rRNA (uracil(1498)-N(3))-methyltransferase [Bacteroidales bacterium]|jgi:16S rRNA (uracil1498-N3)-methyltransferase|nr:16S rRNA (uracil(1498)-N(3))-methyltransferase [Bacteroidales bacterium]